MEHSSEVVTETSFTQLDIKALTLQCPIELPPIQAGCRHQPVRPVVRHRPRHPRQGSQKDLAGPIQVSNRKLCMLGWVKPR